MSEAARTLMLMLVISWRADRARSLAAFASVALQVTTLPLRAIGLRLFTDGLARQSMSLAALGLMVMVGLTALSRLMTWVSINLRVQLRERTQLYIDGYLVELTAGLPGIEHHERPDYLDRVEMVRAERWALANPFNPISWTLAAFLQVLTVFVLLGGVHPLLILLPIAGVPSVLAAIASERSAARLRDSQAESNRLLRHIGSLTMEPAAAKEIRVFGLCELLFARSNALFNELERQRLRLGIRTTMKTVAAWAAFSAAFVGAAGFTANLVVEGQTTLGSLMMVLGLAAQLNVNLGLLVITVNWLVRTQVAVRKLLWLQDYAATAAEPHDRAARVPVPTRLHDGIRFDHVSFGYPGSNQAVLHEVDLFLPAGSTVALVGENGSGKTTLVKLLSGFYQPNSGAIYVDGLDLREFGMVAWRERLAAGFQDFARLRLLARESVGVGSTAHIYSDDAIFGALDRAAGGDVRTALPDGLDTQLGPEFERGVDLSLGQWQKLALGRAMMRSSILLLMLDEPTAALDAPSEHALFQHFALAARDYAHATGAVTLLVSHRFSTVRMADLIVVAAGGTIVERGTHAELVAQQGLYAELYGLQASAYR